MEVIVVSHLHRLEEIFGIIGLSSLGDVLLDGQVEDGDEEVQVREASALTGVVIPEVLVSLIYSPNLG